MALIGVFAPSANHCPPARLYSCRRALCSGAGVIDLVRSSFSRLCVVFCLVLTLVFAGAGMASHVDRIESQLNPMGAHEHLVFSKVILDTGDHHHHLPGAAASGADHAAPHAAPHAQDRDGADHPDGGGHHHHADSGSGLLAGLSPGVVPVFVRGASWRSGTGASLAGFLIHGPERPPQASMIRI